MKRATMVKSVSKI